MPLNITSREIKALGKAVRQADDPVFRFQRMRDQRSVYPTGKSEEVRRNKSSSFCLL